MPNYNRVTIMGHLTRDPEVSETQGGTAIAKFGMAVSRKFKEEEETSFFDVTCFGKTAEVVGKYVSKGHLLLVEGWLKQDRWEKDGQKHGKVHIIGENIQLMPKKQPTESGDAPDENGGMPF